MANPNNDNNNNNLQFSENNKSKIWVNKRTNKTNKNIKLLLLLLPWQVRNKGNTLDEHSQKIIICISL